MVNNFRVKAILDTYYGPLSDSHRYWVGLLLVLRCFLFVINAFNVIGSPAVNLLAISTCILGLVTIKLYIGITYKIRILDVLETSFLLNIAIFAIATYYTNMAGGNQLALASVSVGTAMVTFVMILLYHSYCQIIESCVWQDILRPAMIRLRMRWRVQVKREFEGEEIELSAVSNQLRAVPTTSFITLRESLLDSTIH